MPLEWHRNQRDNSDCGDIAADPGRIDPLFMLTGGKLTGALTVATYSVLTTSLRLTTFEILDDALLMLSDDTDARCVLVMICHIFILFTDSLICSVVPVMKVCPKHRGLEC